MTAKEHYDTHLGNFYVWMAGDLETNVHQQIQFFEAHNIQPLGNGLAIDLGAGHGIQTVALARSGFRVKAIDFNRQLLDALQSNSRGLPVEILEADLREVTHLVNENPELIICWGDTLTHLTSRKECLQLISDCSQMLAPGGKLIFSFRNYMVELTGDNRFIPVKSDANRILTCFLEYSPTHVRVTDLLHERTVTGWEQKVSSYHKVRLNPEEVSSHVQEMGLSIDFKGMVGRLVTLIASK